MIQTIRVTVEAKHTWIKSRRKVLVRLMWSVQQRHAAKLPRTCCHMQSWKIVRQPQTAQNVFKLSLFKRQLGRQRYQTCSVQGASKLTIKLELNWISEAMGQNWVYQLKTIENNVQELKNKKNGRDLPFWKVRILTRCPFTSFHNLMKADSPGREPGTSTLPQASTSHVARCFDATKHGIIKLRAWLSSINLLSFAEKRIQNRTQSIPWGEGKQYMSCMCITCVQYR